MQLESVTDLALPSCQTENALPQFAPMQWTMQEIRAAIPAHLFVRDTLRGCRYLCRDAFVAVFLLQLTAFVDRHLQGTSAPSVIPATTAEILRWLWWCLYWWFQGLTFTGLWVIGHECGHGAFSDRPIVNNSIGYVIHTFLWTPYFSWKISHHRHHSNHASIERDEVYVPKTRSDLNIPQETPESTVHYEDYFADTPIYTLYMLILQQLLAFPAYLLFNVSGQKSYPRFTNHFDPSSVLFSKAQRNAIMLSNVGIATMIFGVYMACARYGTSEIVKYYAIPWLCVSHWFILITYLHHTAPELPHFRGKAWNFQRGAASTVDRPILGWQGRFFLHDVAHYHVIHHFFPKMPFYHGEEATRHLKAFIGDHYSYSDTPTFRALWDTYNRCQFVEDEGDILFYKDKKGLAARRPTTDSTASDGAY